MPSLLPLQGENRGLRPLQLCLWAQTQTADPEEFTFALCILWQGTSPPMTLFTNTQRLGSRGSVALRRHLPLTED